MPRKSKASSAGGDAPENTRIAIVSSDKVHSYHTEALCLVCAAYVALSLPRSLSSASPRSASKSARSHALSCDEVHTHTCTHTRTGRSMQASMLGTFLTLTGSLMASLVVLTGKLCIEVKSTSKLAFISEEVQLPHHASATPLSHSNSPPKAHMCGSYHNCTALHWMWHLCEEVPLWCHQHYQPAQGTDLQRQHKQHQLSLTHQFSTAVIE